METQGIRDFAAVLALSVAVAVLLAFAPTASARFLPDSYAYNAALKDAREHGAELVGYGGSSYGVGKCTRRTQGKVACEVHAESKRYDHIGDDGPVYKIKSCTWTVVSFHRRYSRLVYYLRENTECQSGFASPPFLRPGDSGAI